MTGPVLIRILWGLLALTLGAVVVLWVAPTQSIATPTDVEPLPLPASQASAPPITTLGDPPMPDRNPFDPDGRSWGIRREVRKPDTEPNRQYGAPSGILGLIKVPGLEGALTENGFVSIGGTVDGAQVKRIERDRIVFSLDGNGEKTANWNNEERQRRREAFRRRGLDIPAEQSP